MSSEKKGGGKRKDAAAAAAAEKVAEADNSPAPPDSSAKDKAKKANRPSSGGSSSTTTILLVLVVIVGACGYMAVNGLGPFAKGSSSDSGENGGRTTKTINNYEKPCNPKTLQFAKLRVPEIEVGEIEDFAKRIALADKPVIITNSIVQHWEAADWTIDSVVVRKEWLQRVQTHHNQTYVYSHKNPRDNSMLQLKDVVADHEQKAFEVVDMGWRLFLEHMKDPENMPGNKFYSYVTSLDENLLLRALAKEAHPTDPLTIDWDEGELASVSPEADIESIGSDRKNTRQLWVGPAGSVSHCHYDGFHNFFVQLVGRKRFILFEPSNHTNLALYPFLHPGALQVQASLDDPDFDDFPLLKDAVGYEAIVEPGDVLYVPPLWFHHVMTEKNSVSVSIWSSTQHTKAMYNLFDSPLPFPKPWLKKRGAKFRPLAVRMLIEDTLAAATGSAEAGKAFLADMWEERYRRLVERIPSMLESDTSHCLADLEAKAGSTAAEVRERLSKKAREVAEEINSHFVDDPGRRDIFLANYVEKKIDQTVSAKNVTPFLKAMLTC